MLRTTLISLAALAVVAGAVQAQPPAGAAAGAAAGGGRGGAPGGAAAGAAPGTATAALRLPRGTTSQEYTDNRKGQGVGYELAVEAVMEAINFCKAGGQDVSVQVTDSNNEIIALVSPNEAGMRSLRLLHGKTISTYMTGLPSSQARGAAANNVVLQVAMANDVAVSYPGSVPIGLNGQMIGAITVSGSGGQPTDEACANAGLSKIQSRITASRPAPATPAAGGAGRGGAPGAAPAAGGRGGAPAAAPAGRGG